MVGALVGVLAGVAVLLAGCGDGDPPPVEPPATSPPPVTGAAVRAELAARAAAASDLVGVRLYRVSSPDLPDREMVVVRAADGSWRVDLTGGAWSGTLDIAMIGIGGQLYHCTLPTPPQPTRCVAVSGLTEETDPRVHHLFSDWLDVLRDRSAPVAVSGAPVPEGVGGQCFSVQPSAASLVPPLDPGIYCFDSDGTLTGAQLPLGTITLIGSDPATPDTVTLPGPVVEESPPSLVAPSPTATPSETPTPSPVPTEG